MIALQGVGTHAEDGRRASCLSICRHHDRFRNLPGVTSRQSVDRDALSVECDSAINSDPLAERIRAAAGPSVRPILSYLANSIRIDDRQVPYSLVTAMNPEWPENEIRLNEWAAQDLKAKVGDT